MRGGDFGRGFDSPQLHEKAGVSRGTRLSFHMKESNAKAEGEAREEAPVARPSRRPT